MSHFLRISAVLALALLCGQIAVASAHKPPENPQFIDVAEIESGTTAIGYTVFSSRDGLESFDVKILGVMRNFVGPGQDLVIAELSSERFRKSGVVSGMSGSPVYVGDRLLGAIGYGLGQFTDRPLAGITPIKSMLNTSSVVGAAISNPSTARIKPIGLSLVGAGLNPLTLDLLKDTLAQKGYSELSLAAQSLGAGPAKSTGLFAGGPVAAVVVDGDISLAAIGTVTYIKDNEFVAFGHPFMQGGKSEFAAADAEIVTTAFSLQSALKIGQPTQIIGTVYSDRSAGIAGRIGVIPKMIPMTIELDHKTYNFKLAPSAKDFPMFAAITMVNTLISRPSREMGGTLEAEARIKLKSGQAFTLRHYASGRDVPLEGELAKQFLDEITYLIEQPFTEAQIESMAFSVHSSDVVKRDILQAVYSTNPVRQGQDVSFRMKLQPWQSPPKEKKTSFKIPNGLAPGDYQLLVADRANSIRIEAESGLFTHPVSFDLVLKQLRGLPSEVDLCFYLQKNEPNNELSGFSMPGLPMALQKLTSNFVLEDALRRGKSATRLGCEKMDNLTVGNVAGFLRVVPSKERSIK